MWMVRAVGYSETRSSASVWLIWLVRSGRFSTVSGFGPGAGPGAGLGPDLDPELELEPQPEPEFSVCGMLLLTISGLWAKSHIFYTNTYLDHVGSPRVYALAVQSL